MILPPALKTNSGVTIIVTTAGNVPSSATVVNGIACAAAVLYVVLA